MPDNKEIYLAKGHSLQGGKYRIEQKIGQGGFGITYLARWYMQISGAMGDAYSYAITVIKEFYWTEYCSRESDGKTVSISSATGKDLFAQFKEKLKKEGKLLSKFQHPNIVRVLDIFEENNTAYLVMQYIEGDSLKEVVDKNGRLDEQKALKYVGQLCSALTEIHNEKILHLDIKPSNILIDENDNAQLIDFGVSKQYLSENTGAMSETPFGISRGYSPMEQYSGITKFSPTADVYALGATLYYMLTGKTPLEATIRFDEDMPPIAAYNTDASYNVVRAVEKAMEIRSKDRYQTMTEFWNALNNDMVEAPVVEVNDETFIEPKKTTAEYSDDRTIMDETPKSREKEVPLSIEEEIDEPKSKKWIWIALIALVLVGGSVYLLTRGDGGKTESVSHPSRANTSVPETNSPESQYQKGERYYNSGNYMQAVVWFRSAAEQGLAEAQYMFGNAYFHGLGISQDFTQAAVWFKKAAEQGLAKAQYLLGVCYLGADNHDPTQAVTWFRKASEQGLAEAQWELGRCYLNGWGIPQDYALAKYWWTKAAEQGYTNAIENLKKYFGE